MRAPTVIAEVGCNHMGDVNLAVRMITTAATVCGVDVVKFQKRHARELLTDAQYAAPHPDPRHAYGDSYGEHREMLELDAGAHAQLKAACEDHGVVYSTSVWDVTSAREMIALEPAMLKVPSARNGDLALLDVLCGGFAGEIHLSLGMTTHEEQDAIVEHLTLRGRLDDVVLYACTSGYPVAAADVYLLEIVRLRERYGTRVGFSGHHLGFAIDMAAVALGACCVERHFTLDRTWKGTDHAASLEPDQLRRLARDARDVARALERKPPGLPAVELATRAKLRSSR